MTHISKIIPHKKVLFSIIIFKLLKLDVIFTGLSFLG
jgi:hypothetical protein